MSKPSAFLVGSAVVAVLAKGSPADILADALVRKTSDYLTNSAVEWWTRLMMFWLVILSTTLVERFMNWISP